MPENHSTITCKKGAKILPTFSCIVFDYFGYAVNLEFRFKLNFDQERGSKIEKKVKIQKKLGDPEFMDLGIQNS